MRVHDVDLLDDLHLSSYEKKALLALVDLGIAGVWLALAQRDEFLAVMAQNNGDINALSAHLRAAQAR